MALSGKNEYSFKLGPTYSSKGGTQDTKNCTKISAHRLNAKDYKECIVAEIHKQRLAFLVAFGRGKLLGPGATVVVLVAVILPLVAPG